MNRAPLRLDFDNPEALSKALNDAAQWLNAMEDDINDNLTRAEEALHDARFYLDHYDGPDAA